MQKPIVHYSGKATIIAGRAYLKPINHPNHLEGHNVSNEKEVVTSRIVAYDEAAGRIETQNTVYVPQPGDAI